MKRYYFCSISPFLLLQSLTLSHERIEIRQAIITLGRIYYEGKIFGIIINMREFITLCCLSTILLVSMQNQAHIDNGP